MNERQEKRLRLLAEIAGSVKAPFDLHPQETINELRGKSSETHVTCLHCESTFQEWDIVDFNQKEVCPLCGIAKELGKWRESND